jgi:uncharacterized protein (DUF1697 family)
MSERLYVALLRGINVGGQNIIRMADLKACVEGAGFSDVATYIQSGNVLFRSRHADVRRLTTAIERALGATFGFAGRVVVVSRDELARIVADAPKGFGAAPAKYRYDVIYLAPTLTPREAMNSVTLKDGVDTAHAGRRVLYFSRLSARAAESRLRLLVSTPAYQRMTIRNWNTTVKILALMDR